jgi:hypothetical protein
VSILTVVLASALIATSAANAALQLANLQRRASKRRSAGSVWREAASERGIGLRLALVFLFYGEWQLVKSATGSSSAAAWLVTGIMATIFAWVVWDCGVWLRYWIIRRTPGPVRKNP